MSAKPHAVFAPFPSQGHINPLMKLAKLLHHKGFFITFVNTDYNHKRLLKSKGSNYLQSLPDFRFESISDGLPVSSETDVVHDIPTLCRSTKEHSLAPFRELLRKLNDSAGSSVPPVTCIIADGVMSFPLQAAQEIGIPCVMFWTFGACGLLSLKLCGDLLDKGITPFKDSSYLTDGSLDAPVDWVPGLKDFRLKDVASFIRTTEPNDFVLEYTKEQVEATAKASAVILYTFDDLERNMLDFLSPLFPPMYPIGPLQLLVDQIPDKSLELLDGSLWKADDDSIQWLDSKEPNSVLYVNFGSLAVMTPSEILELANGLADSKKNFFWIIRSDWFKGNSTILPPDFVTETKERGLIASWCDQERVLNHPSVGGFLTHCGWNSTLEGITAGVPFLCMPCASEQPTNSKFIWDEWGIGKEIARNSGRDAIKGAVMKFMDEDRGELKKKAMEWKAKAKEATISPDGSSFLNLENLHISFPFPLYFFSPPQPAAKLIGRRVQPERDVAETEVADDVAAAVKQRRRNAQSSVKDGKIKSLDQSRSKGVPNHRSTSALLSRTRS